MATNTPAPKRWTIADSLETYSIRQWGAGYFGINEKGNVMVHPGGPETPSFDLKELIDEVRRRGIVPPLLIRFTDVLRHRVVHLNEAFRKAISEHNYKGSYHGVYPIKVNQHRYVVEQIVDAGKQFGYGLEAGSKPGRKVVMVVEKPTELALIAEVSRRTGIRPRIGIRVRLSSRGAGKWEASGGDRSKFGLSSSELMGALSFMREAGLIDCFELL